MKSTRSLLALSLLAAGGCSSDSEGEECVAPPSIYGSPRQHTGDAVLSGIIAVPTENTFITDGWLLKAFLRGPERDCDQVVSMDFDEVTGWAHEEDACGPTLEFSFTDLDPGDYTVVLCATAPDDDSICSVNWDSDQVVTASDTPNTDLTLTFGNQTSVAQSCF